MDLCDIIVYHTGISNENIGLLRKLHENTYFREMVFPEEYNVILEHKTAKVWGPYVVAKFAAQSGLKPASADGDAVKLTLADSGVTPAFTSVQEVEASNKSAIAVRIACLANCSVVAGNKIMGSATLPVYELGRTAYILNPAKK